MKLSKTQKQNILNSADNGNEWVQVGQRIGAEALTVVLDTLGGTTGCETYIPSSENFFERLGKAIRDEDIRTRWHQGLTSKLAAEYGISHRRILQIAKSSASESASC